MILKDFGTNIVKRVNLVEIPNLSCFAHTLQSAVNDGLKVQQAVIDAVAKKQKITSYSNLSVFAKQRLYNIQVKLDISKHTILQSVPTHQNLIYVVLERAVEQ